MSVSSRPVRPKYLTTRVPTELYRDLEDLKEDLQVDNVRVAKRQVIGKDGIALAAVSYLLGLPRDEQKKIVSLGIDRLNAITK